MALGKGQSGAVRRREAGGTDLHAHPLPTTAEVLGPAGLLHARQTAAHAARTARAALLEDHAAEPVDLTADPPDQRLIARLGADLCLKHRVLPWKRCAGQTIVLCASPEQFLRLKDMLQVLFGPVRLNRIGAHPLDAALARHCASTLHGLAEARTSTEESCRTWNSRRTRNLGLVLIAGILALFLAWPTATFAILCLWALLTLILGTALKLTATVLHLRQAPETPVPGNPQPLFLPVVSILVPLFKERDIATDLIRRLRRLDYPADKLDICLIVEAADHLTRDTIAQSDLPPNMRAIEVPPGSLQTKPRALNYALAFARGAIIGVYDAEDAPAPDQIRKVVRRFAQCGSNVACLQGRLDYYNSDTNWLSRCFTIEYATWFRLILPGLQRLGLAVPLGGTTLFFRRDILEKLGGWDAHNVTEDADLGIRLARHGYRTEILDTVTEEEANCHVWPWIKQRSRWLKGYAVTYAVHMRRPLKLWQDLGPRGFFGVQLLFLGTLSQFVLAPLLWSFWLIALGLPHPATQIMSPGLALGLTVLFLGAEIIGIAISCIAVRAAGKPGLMKWAPTLHLYFPLAALAAYKGLIELASRPFYWDKTAHGLHAPARRSRSLRGRPPPLRHPGADG